MALTYPHPVALTQAVTRKMPFVVLPHPTYSGWFSAYSVDLSGGLTCVVDASNYEAAEGFCKDYGLEHMGGL